MRGEADSSDERGAGSSNRLRLSAGFLEPPVNRETTFCQNVGAGLADWPPPADRRSPEYRPERCLEPRREPWADWEEEYDFMRGIKCAMTEL